MALPTNRIKKIKLPDNTEYDIVPTTLQDGTTSYAATLPTLTADSTLKVESGWKVINSIYNSYSSSFYFIKVVPTNNLKEPWFITYEFIVYKKDASLSTDANTFAATVKVMSNGKNNSKASVTVIAENSTGAKSNNTTYSNIISNHRVAVPSTANTSSEWPFLLGISYDSNLFSTHEIKIRVIESSNCTITINDQMRDIQHGNAGSGASYGSQDEIFTGTDSGLQCYPLAKGVNLTNSTSTIYLTGVNPFSTTNTDTLYKNYNLYAMNGNMNAKSYYANGYDDDDNSWYTRYDCDQIYVEFGEYQGEEYGEPVYDYYYYTYKLPRKSGTLMVEPVTKTFSVSSLSSVNNYWMFGQLIPTGAELQPWSIEYEIDIHKYSPDSNAYIPQGATVRMSASAGYNKGNQVNIAALNRLASHNSSSGSYFNSFHTIMMINATGLSNGYGFPIGTYLTAVPSGGYFITVRVTKTENCNFEFYNNLTLWTNTSSYSYNTGMNTMTATQNGLVSDSITQAANTVWVGNVSNNNYYYITGVYGNGYNSNVNLYRNQGIYIYNNYLYSNNGYYAGGNQALYSGSSIVTNYGSYSLSFPSKSGTIAVTSDITTITIEDLTSL